MISDLMHSWRALRRTPLMVLVVVGSLGAGIGVNTVVFSWIQALVFRPIPGVANAAAFHLIEPETQASLRPGTSWTEYGDLRERLRSFRELMAFRMVPLNVGEPARTERTTALLARAPGASCA